MEYCWIEDIEKFQEISREWDNAVIASGEDLPFLLSDFIITWWRHYHRDYSRIMIFLVYENGVLIGGLPLCRNRRGYLEHPGRIAANYTEFFSSTDKDLVWKVFLGALTEIKDWRGLILTRIRSGSVNLAALKEAAALYEKRIFFDIRRYGTSYLIDIPKSFTEYISRLPKKLRYYIRRSESGFSKIGAIGLYSINDDAGIDGLIETYIGLSRKAFKGRHKDSAFDDERFCRFFKELIIKFRLNGYLDANALKLNDRIIAVHLGYSLRNNLNYVFTTFESDFADLNPGHLLIYKLLELGVVRGNSLFDMYTGDHLYKRQWSGRQQEILTLEIKPKGIVGAINRFVSVKLAGRLFTDSIKRTIASSPALLRAARRMKRKII